MNTRKEKTGKCMNRLQVFFFLIRHFIKPCRQLLEFNTAGFLSLLC